MKLKSEKYKNRKIYKADHSDERNESYLVNPFQIDFHIHSFMYVQIHMRVYLVFYLKFINLSDSEK